MRKLNGKVMVSPIIVISVWTKMINELSDRVPYMLFVVASIE